MTYPAQTKDGETVLIVKKELLHGEKEYFHTEDGRVFTRSMTGQPLQLIEVKPDASWTDETPVDPEEDDDSDAAS